MKPTFTAQDAEKIETFWSSEGRAMLASAMPSRDRIDALYNGKLKLSGAARAESSLLELCRVATELMRSIIENG